MKTTTAMIIALLAWGIALPLQAHESDKKADVPGFRPPTEYSKAFAQQVESSKIAVFPSIVRTVNPAEGKVTQEYSCASRDIVIEFLGENGLGTAHAESIEFDMSEEAKERGQFALFNHSIRTIGKQLDTYEGDADYILVLDIICIKNSVWGIQCYVLDRKGGNVFSFLLNSHHKALVDAGLKAADASPESKERLIAESTKLAMAALKENVEQERKIAAYKPDPRHVGRYVNQEVATDYIEFKPDGSFVGNKSERPLEGTYAVLPDNAVIITIQGMGNAPIGRMDGDRMLDPDGIAWVKAATIDGFPEATITIIPGTWNSTGPVDKHRRFYELFKVKFQKDAKGNAELLGLLLEEKGYDKYEIADPGFWFPEEEGARKNRAATFGEFVNKLELKTDYALGTEFVFHIEQGIQEVYTVIVNAKGKVVWEDSQKCDETVYDNVDLRITPERLVLATMVTIRLTPVMGLDALPQKELAPEKKKVLEEMRMGESSGGSCPME